MPKKRHQEKRLQPLRSPSLRTYPHILIGRHSEEQPPLSKFGAKNLCILFLSTPRISQPIQTKELLKCRFTPSGLLDLNQYTKTPAQSGSFTAAKRLSIYRSPDLTSLNRILCAKTGGGTIPSQPVVASPIRPSRSPDLLRIGRYEPEKPE